MFVGFIVRRIQKQAIEKKCMEGNYRLFPNSVKKLKKKRWKLVSRHIQGVPNKMIYMEIIGDFGNGKRYKVVQIRKKLRIFVLFKLFSNLKYLQRCPKYNDLHGESYFDRTPYFDLHQLTLYRL